MNAKEWLLKIAQEVEDDPSRWTQGVTARDNSGVCIGVDDKNAKCWCAIGFRWRDGMESASLAMLKSAMLKSAMGKYIAEYNDSLKNYEQFVSWFRSAAEMCE